ncbi:sugar kinase [Pseudarthrobacter sp. NamE2]|uniref:sugar kinase n=1 Tax=Pseudarthrobacter sp. NamE2 TaxID=2576838 RepID=UPI0010FD0170|nr:sugar kinase [Pseudarthrobacter sp. NamE2]TLM81976.1 sugar kinase [Pseudarthrobacter sp. NamE2]
MAWSPGAQPLGERLDVVAIGEAMMLLQAPPPSSIKDASRLEVNVAGAEFNACAAVARLGGRAALLTRIGDDAPGQRVWQTMTELGIETRMVAVDPARPTGIFLRETPSDGSRRVFYYRRGSAASAMESSDADRLVTDQAPRAVLLSGLTAALGGGLRDLIQRICSDAAGRGTAVVVDVNLRPALGGMAEVTGTIRDVLPLVDLLVLGDDESPQLFNTTSPEGVFAAAAEAGVRETVLKGAERGCWFQDKDGKPVHQPALASRVVDPIGAGDAFLGGYLGARLAGIPPAGAAVLGSQFAAGVIATVGDTNGLPEPSEARALLAALSGS